MGFYVKIEKTFETETVAQYTFEGDHGLKGLLALDKTKGEVTLVEPMPGDDRMHCFNRAIVKITREWREGRLPQTLEWAS
ncbi:hypothetical protein ABIC63_005986 [Pseudacidovorax sp. 1753]|uniref:hypothetical protein n=1 Tax=Pseudacidovorax sp. 1753 TaxID=3156419 RepID=UPI0033975E66